MSIELPEIELTDFEKFAVSCTYILVQKRYNKSDDILKCMIKEYASAFNQSHSTRLLDLKNEQTTIDFAIRNYYHGKIDYDYDYVGLTNREKYCVFSVILGAYQTQIPLLDLQSISEQFIVNCKISNAEKVLQAIAIQIDLADNFMIYWLNSHGYSLND